MDDAFVKSVAEAVKAGGRDVESTVAQLFAQHDAADVLAALKHLSQEIQTQLSQRHADWLAYKNEGTHPYKKFAEAEAEYLDWKAAASRYREGINSALRAAKSLGRKLNKHAQGKNEQKASDRGYVPGARVSHDLGEGDVGTVIDVQGRSVWVAWDSYPDLPVQYASPWHFSVIESLEEGTP